MRLPFGRDLLPLLGKELIELSAQPRSYLLRTGFAVALFAMFAMSFHSVLAGASANDLSVLGSGKRMLDALVMVLFLALYLVVPAMVAPTVYAEREAGTLEVLLVSRLQPWQLLAQKLLSRGFAAGTFLLLALPLGGCAYALGGVGPEEVAGAALALALGALQVGAWSLYCGARARTALGGIVRSYVIGIGALGVLVPLALVPLFLLAMLFGIKLEWGTSYPFGIYFAAQKGWEHLPLACLPTLLSTAVLFLMSCKALEFDDRWWAPQTVASIPWSDANERRERLASGDLPADAAVSWRERARIRRWLRKGTAIWWLVLAAVVFVALMVAIARSERWDVESDGATALVVLAHLVAVASVAMHASSLISEERARSTLEVLLATPLEPREIARQKMAGVRMLARLALYGIGGMAAIEALLELGLGVGRMPLYLVAVVGTAWLYLEVAAWLGFAIGLRSRTPAAAAIGVMGTLLAWMIVPQIVANFIWSGAPPLAAKVLSPAWMLIGNEYPDADMLGWLAALAVNSAFYGACALGLRWWALSDASRRLGARGA